MRKSTPLAISLLLSLYGLITCIVAQHHHPMDLLAESEINHIYQFVLKFKLGSHDNLRFQYVGLQAHEKEVVYQWKDG